jgi:hypothetical protein
MVGCRVQKTCNVSRGENRRSREERQGRNESGVWHLRAEGSIRAPRVSKPLGATNQAVGSHGPGSSQEWTQDTDVDGGANIDNPMRGVPILDREETLERSGPRVTQRQPSTTTEEGPRLPDSISEGEAKVTRVRPTGRPTPRRVQTGSPLQLRATFNRRRHKSKKGPRRRPTIRNLPERWRHRAVA